ncbi:MAG: transposase [Deltaproteobacteria bacterium]|nr:transposase [Deltaproteobacteria bacterium]
MTTVNGSTRVSENLMGAPTAARCWAGASLGIGLIATLLFAVAASAQDQAPREPTATDEIESFNGRLRDECLKSRWFESVDDARQALQDWRRDYNEVRPHSSLGDLPPAAFAAQIQGVAPELCSQG